MRIRCPFCGDRAHAEFTYQGDAGPVRPRSDVHASPDPAPFVDFAYVRTNPSGAHREYWQHVAGCRAWLVVDRDVTTHAILGVVTARERNRGDPR